MHIDFRVCYDTQTGPVSKRTVPVISGFHQVEKDAKGAYNKVKKDADKAYKDADKAYKGVTKDFNKDLTAATTHSSKKKGGAATESFAPYN